MAWVKVPPEHHPIFRAALPKDPRVETTPMFGGLAAKANGHIFAGLFGRSTMIWLPEDERADALALEGASYFDPMGDGIEAQQQGDAPRGDDGGARRAAALDQACVRRRPRAAAKGRERPRRRRRQRRRRRRRPRRGSADRASNATSPFQEHIAHFQVRAPTRRLESARCRA